MNTHLEGRCTWSCVLHPPVWRRRRCRCCDKVGGGRHRIPRRRFLCSRPHTRKRKCSVHTHTHISHVKSMSLEGEAMGGGDERKENLWNRNNEMADCKIIQQHNNEITSSSDAVWFFFWNSEGRDNDELKERNHEMVSAAPASLLFC